MGIEICQLVLLRLTVRAEFDVTNVPANGVLTAGSTSTTVNIPNTFDYIYAGAVGLQIDLAEARFTATKSVIVS